MEDVGASLLVSRAGIFCRARGELTMSSQSREGPWLDLLVMTSTMWFRGTFPRLRVDSLMQLSWKWLIPIALVNVMLVSALVLALPGF